MFQLLEMRPDTQSGFKVLRRYILASSIGHLIWEFAQLPLFTVWTDGTPFQRLWYPLHCTGGDMIIASMSLLSALLIFGKGLWPQARYWNVALAAFGIGIGYTIYSEWLNVYVRKSWAYSPLMPMIPGVEIGLTPLLQWIIIPLLAFRLARR
jgi:hypothetical protein